MRSRAQMILLSTEQGVKVPHIAAIICESKATVQHWLKRYLAEGLEGLQDAPGPGRLVEVTEAYRAGLLAAVRRLPCRLHLSFYLWTLQRLVDDLAERTGLRVSDETVGCVLTEIARPSGIPVVPTLAVCDQPPRKTVLPEVLARP